jgi:aminoglycoside phosphotransferase (APT) family kinase protein
LNHPLEARLAAYIAAKMPEASGIAVSHIERISGGASRETYRFRLGWRQGEQVRERRLILRRDPPASLIDTERRVEFAAYRAFHGSAVPVPAMLWLEETNEALGHPFFIAEELAGFQAAPQMLFSGAYDAVLPNVAARKWTILGEIARADPSALGLAEVLETPAPDACWKRELDHWEAIIDKDEAEPQPIARAAIRWLRANPPPPAQKISVVHGDYRTGNFLYSPDGDIKAILDWEMAHMGDPLEDLAWSLDPLWCWSEPELAGRLLPHREAIALWEQGSGLTADPTALRWWQVFASVKGIGIWISSSEDFQNGAAKAPILALAGWLMTDRQQRILVDYLSPNSPHRFFEVAA